MAGFRKIDELIRTFDKEKRLLADMFQKRKSVAFRTDDALALVDHKETRIKYLIAHGVIRESGNQLEMEDVYLKFFEDVLETNEIINVAIVREFIDKLNENIEYFLEEKKDSQRRKYLNEVRRSLRTIALTTLRNVIDLKRNVDNTYKNEPSLKIKKSKLQRLDKKRSDIAALIGESEKLISERQPVFFATAMDVGLQETVNDVKLQLNDAYHNLLEIDRQIINYLNMIQYQSMLLKKLHQLKYLRDQQILEEYTDIRQVVQTTNPVWMEPQTRYSTKPSLAWLDASDDANGILLKVMTDRRLPDRVRRKEAAPISDSFFGEQAAVSEYIDQEEMYNAFAAQGKDLFRFLMDYEYKWHVGQGERLSLFCQIATRYCDRLEIRGETGTEGNVEYAIIYRK